MTIAIIDAGSGNLRSAAKAFSRAASEAGVRAEVVVTSDPAVVARATHIVLPGQGAYGECRRGLAALDGMEDALHQAVIDDGRPFLGICVGMQLLADDGDENGIHEGLGWLGGHCMALTPPSSAYKIPHMGWNDLTLNQPDHPLLAGLISGDHVYFVHSYHVKNVYPEHVLATAEYGQTVTAMVARNNIAGTQFHVEKSQAVGLRLLQNFVRWRP